MRLLIIISLIFFYSCNTGQQEYILISKDPQHKVINWLSAIDSTEIFQICYALPADSLDYFLKHAKGIVITGGEDVNPNRYQKPEYTSVCGEPDNKRDSLETVLIQYAIRNKIPLLGICRGNQIINVANRGTLIPDIPSFKKTQINHLTKIDSAHQVVIKAGSRLMGIVNADTLWVNSRHHQCIDQVAPGFIVSANAPDGINEAIELADSTLLPFLIGVQWHPEGLNDKASYQIGKRFLKASNNH